MKSRCTFTTEVTMAALGSIAHLIQDSYSKSHTNRGETSNVAEVVCRPVQEFFDYAIQTENHIDHSASDKWPLFNEYCDATFSEDGEFTLDPITATAQIIWLHATKNEDRSKLGKVILNVLGK